MLRTRGSPRSSVLAPAMLVAAMLVVSGAGVEGQSAIYGAGLQAWLGCWSAELSATRTEPTSSIVCITPTAHVDVAELLTVQDGRIVARDTVDATGRSRRIGAPRCTGIRSASWSRDGRRVFVRSTGTCAGVPSSTSGLLAMTDDGEWLDVEGISAGGGTDVRVARYREIAPPASLPTATRSTLRAQALATRSVRVAAGAAVRAEDVLEAARAVDSAVVEAWILERAQRFDVSEPELAALVSAGVPMRVADALHAVADPEAYTLARGVDQMSGSAASATTFYDAYGLPLGWGWGDALPRTRYGNGYRDGRRLGHYRPPIVIVRGLDGRPRGRIERGHGGYPPRHGDDGRRGAPAGDPRHPGGSPPAGDPRHASPPPAGATLRLGKPRG
jgi:hypothetical protein